MFAPSRHLFLPLAGFILLFILGGSASRAHVVPVIRSTIQFTDDRIILRETADIRILLDEDRAADFLSASSHDQKRSAAVLLACSEALQAAITLTIDGAATPAQRLCQIQTVAGPDGEPDHLASSVAEIAVPSDSRFLTLVLAADAAASLVLSTVTAEGSPHGRGQVLFPGERSRPIPVPLPALLVERQQPAAAGTPVEPALPENALTPEAREQVPAGLAGDVSRPTPADGRATLWGFLRLGFRHILPDGLDHILFIVGLFLFSHRLRPLLAQVTAFTLAHSITLFLSALNIYQMDGRIAEPLIAASIVVVGLENCLRRNRPDHAGWLRLGIVFSFGLIHGLGIANMLAGYDLGESFLLPLIGFNLGVELGQLCVVGLCFLALGRWLHIACYRRRISIPLSLVITTIGAWWLIERCFFLG